MEIERRRDPGVTATGKRESAGEELARADEELRAAVELIRLDLVRVAATRSDYACFHAVRALLYSEGYEPKTHEGAQHLFNRHFVKTWSLRTSACSEGPRPLAEVSRGGGLQRDLRPGQRRHPRRPGCGRGLGDGDQSRDRSPRGVSSAPAAAVIDAGKGAQISTELSNSGRSGSRVPAVRGPVVLQPPVTRTDPRSRRTLQAMPARAWAQGVPTAVRVGIAIELVFEPRTTWV